MDDQSQGVLNLDEVLGRTTMKVRFQGKEYPLRGMNTLTPEEFGRVMAYGEKFKTLTEEQMQAQGGAVVAKAIDDVLAIIAPSLPRYKPAVWEHFKRGYKRRFVLSLQECVAVLQFWTRNNNTKNAPGAAPRPSRKRHPAK